MAHLDGASLALFPEQAGVIAHAVLRWAARHAK